MRRHRVGLRLGAFARRFAVAGRRVPLEEQVDHLDRELLGLGRRATREAELRERRDHVRHKQVAARIEQVGVAHDELQNRAQLQGIVPLVEQRALRPLDPQRRRRAVRARHTLRQRRHEDVERPAHQAAAVVRRQAQQADVHLARDLERALEPLQEARNQQVRSMLHRHVFQRQERPPKLDRIHLGRAFRREQIRTVLQDERAHLQELHTQLIVAIHARAMLHLPPHLHGQRLHKLGRHDPLRRRLHHQHRIHHHTQRIRLLHRRHARISHQLDTLLHERPLRRHVGPHTRLLVHKARMVRGVT